MPRRTDLDISSATLRDYRAGRVTVAGMAARFGVSPNTVLRNLRDLGVDTSMRTRKREQFARKVEAGGHLSAGSAYSAVAALYGRGRSLRAVGQKLGLTPGAAARILGRRGLGRRPQWCREVFRGPGGERLGLAPFAAKPAALRERQGWTQKRLAMECGLSASAVGYWEAAKKGPSWDALGKLARGAGGRVEGPRRELVATGGGSRGVRVSVGCQAVAVNSPARRAQGSVSRRAVPPPHSTTLRTDGTAPPASLARRGRRNAGKSKAEKAVPV